MMDAFREFVCKGANAQRAVDEAIAKAVNPESQKARKAEASKACRVCGCTECDPCIYPHPNLGETCSWTPDREPLCSVCGAFAWMMVPALSRGISLDELVARIRLEIEKRAKPARRRRAGASA